MSPEIEETCCWNLHLTLPYSPPPMTGVSRLRVAGFPHAFRHIPKDQVSLHKPCPHTAQFQVILCPSYQRLGFLFALCLFTTPNFLMSF